jgi:hypothetical protein
VGKSSLQFNKLISGNWGSSLVGGMGIWKGGKLTSHTPKEPKFYTL